MPVISNFLATNTHKGAKRHTGNINSLCIFLPLCASLWLTFSCHSSPDFREKDLLRAWKADSIFQYTNGFVEKKAVITADDNIVYEYDSTGRLTMKKADEQRSIRYKLVGNDSLIYISPKGRYLNGYRILELTPNRLVLRKNLKPLFPGKNQLLYEIRQFSPASAGR